MHASCASKSFFFFLRNPQVLKRQGPNDFLGALMALPRNLRTMYIHAYQSYLVRCVLLGLLLADAGLFLNDLNIQPGGEHTSEPARSSNHPTLYSTLLPFY